MLSNLILHSASAASSSQDVTHQQPLLRANVGELEHIVPDGCRRWRWQCVGLLGAHELVIFGGRSPLVAVAVTIAQSASPAIVFSSEGTDAPGLWVVIVHKCLPAGREIG